MTRLIDLNATFVAALLWPIQEAADNLADSSSRGAHDMIATVNLKGD